MEQFYTMVQVQASLFIYMAVGYVASKKGLITRQARSYIMDLLLDILLPCMIFNSFHQDITTKQLLSASAILVVALVLSLFAWLVGWLLYRNYPAGRASVLRYGTLVANSGFAGLPLIQSAYGPAGLFYAAIFIIPNRIFMWTAGISMFGNGEKGAKGSWVRKMMLNPCMIAVALGLVRMLLHVPLPGFVDSAIAGMGNCTTSISFLLVGSILADVNYKTIFSWDAFGLAFVRLVALPMCALLALKAIGFDALATAVSVVLTGMPIGATTAILGEQYGGDSEFASKCVFVTTLLSLITIPVLTIFL